MTCFSTGINKISIVFGWVENMNFPVWVLVWHANGVLWHYLSANKNGRWSWSRAEVHSCRSQYGHKITVTDHSHKSQSWTTVTKHSHESQSQITLRPPTVYVRNHMPWQVMEPLVGQGSKIDNPEKFGNEHQERKDPRLSPRANS